MKYEWPESMQVCSEAVNSGGFPSPLHRHTRLLYELGQKSLYFPYSGHAISPTY